MKRFYAGIAAVNLTTKVITRTPCHHWREDFADNLVKRATPERVDVSYFQNESDSGILSRLVSLGFR